MKDEHYWRQWLMLLAIFAAQMLTFANTANAAPLRELEDLKAIYETETGWNGVGRDFKDTTGAPFVRFGEGWQGQDIRAHVNAVSVSPGPCTFAGGAAECQANGFPDPDLPRLDFDEACDSYILACWTHVHNGETGLVMNTPPLVSQADPMSADDGEVWPYSGTYISLGVSAWANNPDAYRVATVGYGAYFGSPTGVTSGQLLDSFGNPDTACTLQVSVNQDGGYVWGASATSRLRFVWIFGDGSHQTWLEPANDDKFRLSTETATRELWFTDPNCDLAGFSSDTVQTYQGGGKMGVHDVKEHPPLTDTDGDFVPDVADNCTQVANFSQCNSDEYDSFGSGWATGDQWGNACDGDFDQDGDVDTSDFNAHFLPDFQALPPVDSGRGTDMDCDGDVDGSDFSLFLSQFEKGTPGP